MEKNLEVSPARPAARRCSKVQSWRTVGWAVLLYIAAYVENSLTCRRARSQGHARAGRYRARAAGMNASLRLLPDNR